MLRPSDVMVLFAISLAEEGWTLRSLAERLGVPHSKVQRGIDRLTAVGLYDQATRRVVPHAAVEFLVHGLRYLHPLSEGPSTRGVPTAWGAAPLVSEILSAEPPPVWPQPQSGVRGPAVEPLDSRLPGLARAWPEVAELAALADAVRLGDARTRKAAERHIRERLSSS